MICWYDYETTGLTRDRLMVVEVAYVLTTNDFVPVARASYLVRSFSDDLEENARMVQTACETPYAVEMHRESGLFDALRVGPILRPDEVQEAWVTDLDAHSDGELWVSAGSGVSHFDHEVTRSWFPEVHKRLTYYDLDTGVLRRFAEQTDSLEPPPPDLMGDEHRPHRAMDDTVSSLNSWRWYLHQLTYNSEPFEVTL